MDVTKDDIKAIETTEFTPKPIQIEFGKLYMEVTTPRKTQAQIAEILGVHRNTVANWLHDKEFRTWLNSKCNEMIEKCLVQLYQIGLTQALRGKFDFWKVIMELAGVYTPGVQVKGLQPKDSILIEVINSTTQITQQDSKETEGNQ